MSPERGTCHSSLLQLSGDHSVPSTARVTVLGNILFVKRVLLVPLRSLAFPPMTLFPSRLRHLLMWFYLRLDPCSYLAVLQNPHTSSSCSAFTISPQVRASLTWNPRPGAPTASKTFPLGYLVGFSTITRPKLCSRFPSIPQISSSWVLLVEVLS